MSESIMMYMTNKGMSRQVAHEILKESANQPDELYLKFVTEQLLEAFPESDKKEIYLLFDPTTYLGAAQELIDRVLEETK